MSLKDIFSRQPSRAETPVSVPESQDLATPFKLEGTDEEKADLVDVINRIAASKMGKQILEEASALGYTVKIGHLGATMGACRSQSKELIMSDKQDPDKWVSTLVHEARHAGQIGRGAIAGYSPFVSMKSQLPEKRLMEADAVACSIHVCEELFFQNDYMPLSRLRRDYLSMVYDYEDAQNGRVEMTEKETGEVMSACLLGWYNNEARKMAYEMSHVLDPLSRGELYANRTGVLEEFPVADSVKKICTLNGVGYFAQPLSVLQQPERAGLSKASAAWVEEHVKACNEAGVSSDPSLRHLPSYEEKPYIKSQTEENYGKMPEFLSETGLKNLKDCREAGKSTFTIAASEGVKQYCLLNRLKGR